MQLFLFAKTEQTLGENLGVKASKIVAGLEVDKTNVFLTKLAEAAASKADASPAVESSKESKRGKSPSTTARKVGSGGKKKDVSPSDPTARKVSPNSKTASEGKTSKNSSASVTNNAGSASNRGKKKASPEAESARKANLSGEEVAEAKGESFPSLGNQELDRANGKLSISGLEWSK